MRLRRLFLIAFIGLLLFVIFHWNKNFNSNIDLCPACYGEDFCSTILEEHYKMESQSRWKVINWILNLKNVHFISVNNENFVMKKLAHDRELAQFDESLCYASDQSMTCDVSKSWKKILHRHSSNVSSVLQEHPDLFSESEVIKCNHSLVLHHLISSHMMHDKSIDAIPHFLTLLAVNPEPLILKAFGDLKFIPRYKGSCGRAIIETHEGRPLSSFYDTDWKRRAKLAIQLLRIAQVLSENSIRIYLTDTSADNFSVDSQGILRIIDLESLVLVDSTIKELDENEHMNEGLGCQDCLSFTYESLCNHRKADHNYFAICKGLLSHDAFSPSMKHGLLHDFPDKILSQNPDLIKLIDQCAQPTQNIRKKSAWSLQKMLENIVT